MNSSKTKAKEAELQVHNTASDEPLVPPEDEEQDGNASSGTAVHAAEHEEDEDDYQSDEEQEEPSGPPSLVDELGVDDLTDILFADRGRIFSAAGRMSPVAEFNQEGVLLRPPQLPFTEGEQEIIIYKTDERGILLNELGEPRRIVGAKFRGNSIYTLGETKPGTVKHYAAWFDDEGKTHKLFVHGEALTADMIFRIRNRTHDGEIAVFPEITTD